MVAFGTENQYVEKFSPENRGPAEKRIRREPQRVISNSAFSYDMKLYDTSSFLLFHFEVLFPLSKGLV